MALGQSIGHDSRVAEELLDSRGDLFLVPIDQTQSNQIVENMIVVIRPFPGFERLKRSHSIEPNVVVQS